MSEGQAVFHWGGHGHIFSLRNYSSNCYHSKE